MNQHDSTKSTDSNSSSARCTSDVTASVSTLQQLDDLLASKDFIKRGIDAILFSEWSTPYVQEPVTVLIRKPTKRPAREGNSGHPVELRNSQRSLTYNEDEWVLRYNNPYWKAMTDGDRFTYIPNNGCYRCMKLRNYPEKGPDFFKLERAMQIKNEPKQLQREVTNDLRKQFRLLVHGNNSGHMPEAGGSVLRKAALSSRLQEQPIAEVDDGTISDLLVLNSENAADLPICGDELLSTGPTVSQRTTGHYEIPTEGLTILKQYSAKDLALLSRNTFVSEESSKGICEAQFGVSEKVHLFHKAFQGDTKQQQHSRKDFVFSEAFVVADDALHVKKLSRKRELRPVEKVTPKQRQAADSTKFSSSLAKLRYTTTSGDVISMPVYGSSRSHSTTVLAESGIDKSALFDVSGRGGTPHSVPASPDVRAKRKGKRVDLKGFAMPDERIQEKCLPAIAGIRIPTVSGSRR